MHFMEDRASPEPEKQNCSEISENDNISSEKWPKAQTEVKTHPGGYLSLSTQCSGA
jgi:hypothetical protein